MIQLFTDFFAGSLTNLFHRTDNQKILWSNIRPGHEQSCSAAISHKKIGVIFGLILIAS